ncbi:MAG: Gfo/Idh/MocA family oxidoreductase, partial [Ruthenibacterium sp.]
MKVRFAVIGSNFIVERFLAAAALCPEFTLSTVYSRTQERAQELSQKWGAPHACSDLAALAEDKTVDAVYLASPNVCHAQQAILMLRAGKHVLCEKPMATDMAEFEAMCAAARESGTVLMEAMRSAHGPALPMLRQTVEQLGALRTAEFSYCQYSSRYQK